MKKKALCLALGLALLLGPAAGCAAQAGPPTPAPAAPTPTAVPTAIPTAQPAPENRETVNLGLLKGPTGMGAAKLMADNENGTSNASYHVALGSDPVTDIVPKLINAELDVAAIPTNLAATLYNRTEGGIRLLALNTLGVLHILENGGSVHSLADLAGKTLYATGQGANPEYVLNYLLGQNGLVPGVDVDIEWKPSDELTALMASGEARLCMLPVPAATAVMMQNRDVRDAIDLNDAWQESGAQGAFTMGCLVARTQWLEEHRQLVPGIMSDFADSVAFACENPEEAAALMEQFGIIPKASVAKEAIPQANLVWIDANGIMDIAGYYEVLFAADPTSIGGSIPDDAFYYVP